MAIVLFPLMHPTDTDFSVISRHMKLWGLAQLPNPFEEHDINMLKSLDGLYTRLEMYMEDYITKATAIYPPRAYLALPDLSPRRGPSTFRNKSIGLKTLKLDDLSDQERHRLLRAFLRYEFMCKIYHPRQGSFDELDPINYLRIDEHFNLQSWEYEAIRCVHHYVKNLYGAVFAHHANSWLPNVPKVPFTQSFETVSESELLFPENVLFLPSSYYYDFRLTQRTPDLTTRAFADFGFDLITFILRFPRDVAGCSAQLKQWLWTFSERSQSSHAFQGPLATFLIRRPNLGDPTCENWKQLPGMVRELSPQLHPEVDGIVYHVYEQRAWVFFDDARHYPHQSTSFHFPTEKQLVEHEDHMRVIYYHNLMLTASQRRSQAWHDGYYTARIDENEPGHCETFSFGDEDASRVLRFFEAFSSDESSIF